MITLALIIIGIILGLAAVGITWFLVSFEVAAFVIFMIVLIALIIAISRN